VARRSNCFFFAWWLYFVRMRGQGYCAIRRVHPPLSVGGHWVFIPYRRPMRTLHWQPWQRGDVWWREMIAKIWYAGRIRRYDFEWGSNRTR